MFDGEKAAQQFQGIAGFFKAGALRTEAAWVNDAACVSN
jgi:hypothetical protein